MAEEDADCISSPDKLGGDRHEKNKASHLSIQASAIEMPDENSAKSSLIEAVSADERNSRKQSGLFEEDKSAKDLSNHPDSASSEITTSDVDSSPKKEQDVSFEAPNDDARGKERIARMSTDITNQTEESLSAIDPPPSRGELFRDAIFRFLDRPLLRTLGFVVIFLVIVDGAFFFFLMVGVQNMCVPKTDCEPRNWWLNFSLQALCALFTYTSLASLPPRLSNAIHLITPKRSSEIGKDHYGRDTKDMWFHIPPKRRGGIVALLLGNCFTQYANQITRIIYHTYESSNAWPGSLWVNIFFGLSMIFAGIGAFWQLWEQHRLHVNEPNKFPPGPIAIVTKYGCRRKVVFWTSEHGNGDGEGEGEGEGESDVEAPPSKKKRRKSMTDMAKTVAKKTHKTVISPWKMFRRWMKKMRPSMRLWGF